VVENCDDLRREVKHRGSKMVGIKYSHGEEGIELQSGLRIRFKARTGAGGRGFSCDTLYLDEAMILPEAFLGATVPTLSARSNPQIWLAGSAPDEEDPTHDGVVLAKRRKRALAGGDGSLAYFEHSADCDEDPDEVPAAVLDDPGAVGAREPGARDPHHGRLHREGARCDGAATVRGRAARDRSLANAAVAGAMTRPLGDAWAWSRKNSTVDISPLVACTLALWGLETLEPSERSNEAVFF
jgi:hypothetical protein